MVARWVRHSLAEAAGSGGMVQAQLYGLGWLQWLLQPPHALNAGAHGATSHEVCLTSSRQQLSCLIDVVLRPTGGVSAGIPVPPLSLIARIVHQPP